MQAQQAATIHITTAAAKHPELFRVHGAKITQSMAQLPPELRTKPEGVNIAVANVLLEEAAATGDLAGSLKKLAALAEGKPAPTPAPKKAKAPLPAGQRQPASTVRETVTRKVGTVESNLKRSLPGLSPRIYQELLEEV